MDICRPWGIDPRGVTTAQTEELINKKLIMTINDIFFLVRFCGRFSVFQKIGGSSSVFL